VADIISPSMLVGLALGRIGCFFNGCCFGSVCLTASYALTFPGGLPPSPPYQQQEQQGWRSGVWLEEERGKVMVAYLAPGTAAEQGLKVGDEITSINGAVVSSVADARKKLLLGGISYEVQTADGRIVRWHVDEPPPRSVPIHPTQL
jgi:phosphatidylglycerol:prolipoprotein diacylglycerol transferase